MRLFSSAIAERLIQHASPQLQITPETVRDVAEERERLLKRSDTVVIFLFTALTVIAVIVFGYSSDPDQTKLPVLGLTVTDPQVFCFLLFMIGNIVYVVHTGLFLKIFVLEYMIFFLVTEKDFKGSRIKNGLLYSFHANIFEFLRFNQTLENANTFSKLSFGFTAVYSRYFFLVAYGIYYYGVLIAFFLWLAPFDTNERLVMTITLAIVNVLSIVTTVTIFLPYKAGIPARRKGLLRSDTQNKAPRKPPIVTGREAVALAWQERQRQRMPRRQSPSSRH